LRVNTPRQAHLLGTEGRLTIEYPWWRGSRFTVRTNDDQVEEFAFDNRGGGYTYEAEAFGDMIRSKVHDSDVMPLAESLAILETMDEIRRRWGLRYPGE
jgi:predicted dehydrogenase